MKRDKALWEGDKSNILHQGSEIASENEQREGRISLRVALGAFGVLLLYPIILGAYWAVGDNRTSHAVEGAIEDAMFFLLLPTAFVSFTLAVAGLVYGYGGRGTKQGRIGIVVSCLYMVVLAGAYLVANR